MVNTPFPQKPNVFKEEDAKIIILNLIHLFENPVFHNFFDSVIAAYPLQSDMEIEIFCGVAYLVETVLYEQNKPNLHRGISDWDDQFIRNCIRTAFTNILYKRVCSSNPSKEYPYAGKS